jgi:hypothetical protein
MTATCTPAVVDFRPPQGVRFTPEAECSVAAVSRDLCRIAAFLQSLSPFSKLLQYEDWRDHDGLHFERRKIDFHGLFQLVQTPRALLEATPVDVDVYVGILAEDRSWYLRFRTEWDDRDENLIGIYDLTLDPRLAERFEGQVIPILECPVSRIALGQDS